jgi:DNA-binding XRE family transcriptional regulator
MMRAAVRRCGGSVVWTAPLLPRHLVSCCNAFRHFGFIHSPANRLPGNEVFWQYATSVASSVKRIFCIGFSVPVNRIPEAVSSQIVRLLKAEREKRGISLNSLAQKAGVNRQTVAFIEQGLRNPTLNTLFRLTAALEVEPEKIIARARKLAGG